MQYMGSKNKIAKHILPIMLAERNPDQWWVEADIKTTTREESY